MIHFFGALSDPMVLQVIRCCKWSTFRCSKWSVNPVLDKAKADDFQWFPYFEKGSIICRSTSALFWPKTIYQLLAWLFFLAYGLFENYNPNVTLGTCTSVSWAGNFFVVESFSPGWTDCLPQALVEISANGPLSGGFHFMTHIFILIYDHMRIICNE